MSDPRSKRAAFFDLDRTLIPGSSLFLLARGLYERDMFRVRDLLRFGWGQMMFRLRGEAQRGMEKSRTSTLEFVKGRNQQELMAWGREIAAEQILPRVYRDIVDVIDGHRERGDLTFLVTAAPIELAETIAQALDMTGAIATVSEVDDFGRYTGRLAGAVMHGPEKAKAVAEVALDHNLDLMECAAYSDSKNDLPLLESVGHPHAVNPEGELKRIAFTRGWPIHELRTRRRALLIGIPAGVGGAAVFGGGIALGAWLERRRAGRSRGAIQRFVDRILD
ncbi:MAG TPA: HAD-IB family hydrolase [Actinomycetota bacterium]|nr:HAD-IB family hydrolase [Actinomycetota bacterium]